MTSSQKVIGLAAAGVVVIISALVFYLSYIELSNRQEAFVVMGVLAILFAIVSYLMHAVIAQAKVVSGFVWAYYAFGFASMIYGTAIVRFNVLYVILVLLFALVSLAFIYWRISTMSSNKS